MVLYKLDENVFIWRQRKLQRPAGGGAQQETVCCLSVNKLHGFSCFCQIYPPTNKANIFPVSESELFWFCSSCSRKHNKNLFLSPPACSVSAVAMETWQNTDWWFASGSVSDFQLRFCWPKKPGETNLKKQLAVKHGGGSVMVWKRSDLCHIQNLRPVRAESRK